MSSICYYLGQKFDLSRTQKSNSFKSFELKWHPSKICAVKVAPLKYSQIVKRVRFLFSSLLSPHLRPLSAFQVIFYNWKGRICKGGKDILGFYCLPCNISNSARGNSLSLEWKFPEKNHENVFYPEVICIIIHVIHLIQYWLFYKINNSHTLLSV